MRPPSGEILQNEYRQRVSQVIDHIHYHYGEDLNLDKLASMASMSKFHFHRVFRSVAGEPAGDFIRRIRVKESLNKLIYEPHKSITTIAFECGFSSSQNFTKMFKANRGFTPSDVRKNGSWQTLCEKIKNMRGKKREELLRDEVRVYDSIMRVHQVMLTELLDQPPVTGVEIKKMPDSQIAYIRNIGTARSDIDANIKRLYEWAAPRSLCYESTMLLVMMWSKPEITPEDKRIFDACITVPESARSDKWVNIQKIPGGLYAVHRCEIKHDNFANTKAWLNLFFNWLIPSIYQFDARPQFQHILNNPYTHPDRHLIMDLYLPVKPVYE